MGKALSEIRSFGSGSGMNLDVDTRLLASTEYLEAWNILVGSTPNIGCATNVRGTTNVFDLPINSDFALQSGTAYTMVGSCPDIKRGSIIYFLRETTNGNTHFDAIIRLFLENSRLELILSDLNLRFHGLIDADVMGDDLTWTDGYEDKANPLSDFTPPRSINILKACAYSNPYYSTRNYYKGQVVGFNGKCHQANKATYGIPPTTGTPPVETAQWNLVCNYSYTTITPQILDFVKYPITRPHVANAASQHLEKTLSVSYDTDPSVTTNKLHGRLYQFRLRPLYEDNQYAVWGDTIGPPLPSASESFGGGTIDSSKTENVINCWMWTGTREVTRVDLAVREGNSGRWRLLNRMNKYAINGNQVIGDNTFILFKFYNDSIGEALAQAEVERLYDDVPLTAAHQEIIEKNRMLYAKYRKGYDPVAIAVSLQAFWANDANGGQTIQTTIPWDGMSGYHDERYGGHANRYNYYAHFTKNLSSTFTPDSVFHLSLIDESGVTRQVYVEIQPNATYTDFLNQLRNVINNLPNGTSGGDYGLLGWDEPNGPSGNSFYAPNTGDVLWIDVRQNLIASATPPSPWPNAGENPINAEFVKNLSFRRPIFKDGCFHYFGLGYSDAAGRLSPLNANDQTKLYIPFPTENPPQNHNFKLSTVTNYPYIMASVNHKPPVWADYYQWYYAGTSIEWYLQFTVPAMEPSGNITTQSKKGGIARIVPVVINGLSSIGAPPYVAIFLNKEIANAHDAMSQFNIPEYQWQKGDRVRFIYQMDSDNPTSTSKYVRGYCDKEILGFDYISGAYQTQNVTGETNAFITDSSGKRLYDEGYQILRVEDFNIQDYFDISMVWDPWQKKMVPGYNADYSNVVCFEVYRPRKVVVAEDGTELPMEYFALGEKIPILHPHTSVAVHGAGYGNPPPFMINYPPCDQVLSTGSGNPVTRSADGYFMMGDSYFKYRFNGYYKFPVQALEFSDYYNSTCYPKGNPNIVSRDAMSKLFGSSICWGGQFSLDTKINDISVFDGKDTITLKQNFGDIYYMVESGYTLKVLQQSKPTSIYIGRNAISQAKLGGQTLMASNDSVLGVPEVNEEIYGTIFPAIKHRIHVYFYDIFNGCICRDSSNGIVEISSLYDPNGKPHGIRNFMAKISAEYRSDGVGNISVQSGWDQVNGMVFFSFKDSVRPELNMTLGFSEDDNRWIAFYDFNPDGYGFYGSTLTYFDLGRLWLCNDSDTYNNFSGKQYSSKIRIVANTGGLITKRFKKILISANKLFSAPNTGDIYIKPTDNNPKGMVSLLKSGAFTSREGKFVSDFGQSMVTHQNTPTVSDLVNGEDLRGPAIEVNLMNNDTDEVVLFGVQVESITSN